MYEKILHFDTYHFWLGAAILIWSFFEAYYRRTFEIFFFTYTVEADRTPLLYFLLLLAKFAIGAWIVSLAYRYD